MPMRLYSGAELGDYEIRRPIGSGGMGTAYKGIRSGTKEPVVIKVLSQRLSGDDSNIKRFLREARLCQSIDHPNVVEIFDVGEKSGLYFLVMEYVEGRTISEHLADHGPFSERATLGHTINIASGLEAVHAKGVVHRDIKLSNILIATTGTPKIIDFGLARHLESSTNLTEDGARMGTPAYMSPEQCVSTDVEFSSDLYSLGMVMLTMMSGRNPYFGLSPVSAMFKIVNEPPPRPRDFVPEISDAAAELLEALLSKKPGDRPASAAQLAKACRQILDGEYQASPQVDADQTTINLRASHRKVDESPDHRSQTRRLPGVRTIGAFVGIAVIVATVAFFLQNTAKLTIQSPARWESIAYSWRTEDGKILLHSPRPQQLLGNSLALRWQREVDGSTNGSVYWIQSEDRIEIVSDLSMVTPLDVIQFPLSHGDRWSASVMRRDVVGRLVAQERNYEAVEDIVSVPAGTFRTLRVTSRPAADAAEEITVSVDRWFAPDVGIVKIDTFGIEVNDALRSMELVEAVYR